AATPAATNAPAALPVATPAGSAASDCPILQVQSAYVENPVLEPCYPTAQQIYIEGELGEIVSAWMLTKDAAPVVFEVPEQADSMAPVFGAIDFNPAHGSADDLDLIAAVGEPKLSTVVCPASSMSGLNGPLTPGERIVVTVPWRAASWVDLPGGRLRVKVCALFHKALPSA